MGGWDKGKKGKRGKGTKVRNAVPQPMGWVSLMDNASGRIVCMKWQKWMILLCGACLAFITTMNETRGGIVVEGVDDTASPGVYRLLIDGEGVPGDGKLMLPADLPPVMSAWWVQKGLRTPLNIGFAADGSKGWLEWVDGFPTGTTKDSAIILAETATRSGQVADGRILFTAADAAVRGNSAKLESHHQNHRIGFWTNADDGVEWPVKLTRTGMYDVELTYSLAGGEGSRVTVSIGDVKSSARIMPTGTWYRYSTVSLGEVYIEKSGETTVRVGCVEKTGGAVMNLKAVVMRPTSEGTPPTQSESGEIELHSRDATVQGVMLRYEPAAHKNTLGYWVNVDDKAYWDFTIHQPGRFRVKVYQGCGTDQGGSEALVRIGERTFPFTVQDTGHFQNFIERDIGEVNLTTAGQHRLSVEAVKKAKAAVMDVRRIVLEPVGE